MRRERAPELDRAEVRGVVGAALAEALDARLDDHPRRVEVGLPHPEADDVVHGGQDVEEAPDPRRRDRADALRERTLRERRTGGLRGHDAPSPANRAAIRSEGLGVDGSSSAARSAGGTRRQSASAVTPSYARAARNSSSSDHGAPMTWRPTGRP